MRTQVPPARNPTEPPMRTQALSPALSAEQAFTMIVCTGVLIGVVEEMVKEFRLNPNSSRVTVSFGGITIPPTSIQEIMDRGRSVLEELKHDQ